jgi:hypothetical protein
MKLASDFTKIQEIRLPNFSTVHHLSPLSSGEAWASDMKGNLVHFDEQGNLLHTHITGVSTGMGYHTVTTEGELLYTHPKNKAIYRVTRHMTITTLTTTGDWEPGAIYSSHINGDLLVGMTRKGDWKVTRYSKDGKKLQDIQWNVMDYSVLYQSISYLTENINGDICVSDSSALQVVVVTQSGQYRFSFPVGHSFAGFYPYGFCADTLGHIIVCNNVVGFSGNVLLLSKDGRLLKILDADQVQSVVRAVCVDDQHNLWVGRGGSNVVSVYRYLET